jgi:hypothetical protein
MIHQIETHLNAISQEPSLMGQWNHYELAYEEFISAGSFEDLLGVVLNLRSCAQVLDPPNQEIWSKQKLEQLEQDVRRGTANGAVREEIASLARAIYECGFRFIRDSSLRSRVMRSLVLSTNCDWIPIAFPSTRSSFKPRLGQTLHASHTAPLDSMSAARTQKLGMNPCSETNSLGTLAAFTHHCNSLCKDDRCETD